MTETMNRDRKGVFLMFVPHNASANLLFVVSLFFSFTSILYISHHPLSFLAFVFTILPLHLHPRSFEGGEKPSNQSRGIHRAKRMTKESHKKKMCLAF
jgi:hypothetical protein